MSTADVTLPSTASAPPTGIDTAAMDALPSAPPLDEQNDFLDPSNTTFSVDDFLLSRVTGSTLSQITAELEQYAGVLRTQLEDVVDRDFRGFVALGAGLKAEAPRIARLAWQRPKRPDRHEEEDAASAQDGSLGLNHVRAEVEAARDEIRDVEQQVRSVMRQREDIESQKSQLSLLLSFNDSLRRLEELLLVSANISNGNAHATSDTAPSEEQRQLWASFDDAVESDRGSDVDSAGELSPDTDGEQEEVKHAGAVRSLSPVDIRTPSSQQRSRRLSKAVHGRRNSYDPLASKHSHHHHHYHHHHASVDLPARIARASSEHATLMFLRNRALQLDLSAFVKAHAGRMQQVKGQMRSDLRRVVEMLTRLDGASLLLNSDGRAAKPVNPALQRDGADLATWSQLAKPEGDEMPQQYAEGAWKTYWNERVEEQRRWLSLALATWQVLGSQEDGVATEGSSVQAEVEEVVRYSLVEPWVRENIKADSLSRQDVPIAAVGSSYEQVALKARENDESDEQAMPLRSLYNRTLAFAAGEMQQICEVFDQVGRSTAQEDEKTAVNGTTEETSAPVTSKSAPDAPSFDVFANVLWADLSRQLMDELGGQLFFVGKPDIFHRNYSVTSAFLAAFTKLAPSDEAAAALQQHSTYIAFQKRWQLPVYFQMKYRETVSRLETRLAAAAGSSASSVSSSPPLLDATVATLEAFVAPWKTQSHLFELSAREWRLSLQVVSRYRTWLDGELPHDVANAARPDARSMEKAMFKAHTRADSGHSENPAAGSSSPVRSNVPSRSGTPQPALDNEAAIASDDAALRSLTIIAADALWLKERVLAAYDEEVIPKLRKGEATDTPEDAEIRAALRDALAHAVAYDTTLLPQLSQRIVSVLRTRCADPLRLVRSISTQYRGNATPTAAKDPEPSYFVPQILRPLRMYLGKAERRGDANLVAPARNLDKATRSLWASEVVEDVLYRYRASLYAMNKNYESLRRLKRGNQGGIGSIFGRGNAGSAAEQAADADAERMRAQMCVDVAALERDVKELVEVETEVSVAEEAWDLLRAAAKGATDEVV